VLLSVNLFLSSASIDIPLLSNGTNRRFSSNDTVQVLLDGMMIDEIIEEIYLDSFFSQCNPSSCSYAYSQRFNVFYSLTIIIGVFGGLPMLLRMIAILVAVIVLRRQNRHSINNRENHTVDVKQQNQSEFICQKY
jgi:hypothetical protein